MKKFIPALFLFISFYCYSQTTYSVLSVSSLLKDSSNSTVLEETTEIDIIKKDKMAVKKSKTILVYNSIGNDDVDAYLSYDADTKVKNVEAYVYDALGEEIEHFKKKDFKDVSAVDGFSLYKDDRVLYLEYTPTRYPYTVVFNTEIESNSTAFIPIWMPLKGYHESTKKSTYRVTFNPESTLRMLSKNLEGFDVEVTQKPGIFVLTAKNLPAQIYEEHSLPIQDKVPFVRFALNDFSLNGQPGSGKNWSEFGKWMNDYLLADTRELPEATLTTVRNLVKNETTNEGKARKIYQYVQDKVRYISIQIGIGGWKPMLASEVDQLSYGDCKALTNYTKVLLDAVGVPSYYTVLYAGDEERNIEKEFSSIQGNHVILGVLDEQENITWLECTSQDTPYGFLGNFTDDRDVLMITPQGGKIGHTKIYGFEENLQQNTVVMQMEPNGAVNATLSRVSKGQQYDNAYGLSKQTPKDLESHLKNRWSYINGFELTDIQLKNSKEDISFTETIQVNIPRYATPVGADYLFCINAFNQLQYIPPRLPNRTQIFNIAMGYTDVDTVTIRIPEGYTIDTLPTDVTLEYEFGSYKLQFKEASENTLTYTRNLQVKKGKFPPEAYEQYRSFRKSIAKLDKTKVLIKKTE